MTEREQEIEQALQHLNANWNAQQTERALGKLHQRIRRRARAARVGVGVAGIALGAWLFGPRAVEMYRSSAEARADRTASQLGERGPVTFSDGSKLTALDAQTRVSVLEAAPQRIVAGVEQGSVRFEVSHHPERVFRAQVGNVTVEALGTIFTVERLEQGAWVSVTRGRVRVEWPGGTRELAVGEADRFPPRAVATSAAESSNPEARGSNTDEVALSPSSDDVGRRSSAEGARPQRWKALAAQGKNGEAYAALGSLTPSQLRDPEELLLASDAARLSGHPRQALPFLERVLSQFRRDARAPVAAFNLGTILMTSLASPAKAATRFAEARSLAPSGAIAGDALAREVEAWSLAGQAERAHDRALEYVRLYPQGQRSAIVRKFGSLE